MVLEARLAKLRARLAHSPVVVLVRLDYVACRIECERHIIMWLICERARRAHFRCDCVSINAATVCRVV